VTALEDDAGLSPGHASAIYTLVGAALVAGGVVLGRLSDRRGRGWTLVFGYLTMAGAIVVSPVGVEPLASLTALVFGIAMSGLPAVVAAHMSDVLTPREFAGAFGRATLAFGVAQLCGPPIGGVLAEWTGTFRLPFALAAAAALAGAALSLDVLRASAPARVAAEPRHTDHLGREHEQRPDGHPGGRLPACDVARGHPTRSDLSCSSSIFRDASALVIPSSTSSPASRASVSR